MPLIATNPGQFDRRLTLRYPTESRDSVGAVVEAWVELSAIWGAWLIRGSREFRAAQAQWSGLNGLLRIRYRTGITAGWRVMLEGVLYQLVGEPQEVGRRQWLDLPLQTVQPAPGSAAPLSASFEVNLAEGDTQAVITYPTAFAAPPSTVQLTLVIPEDGETFYLAVVEGSRTASGCTVELGAAVPGPGYKLSLLATQ